MAAPRMAEKKKGGFRKPVVKTSKGKRILCISDLHGSLRQINRLVKLSHADVVVHVGSFGFFDGDSADGMSAEKLATVAQASHLVVKNTGDNSGSDADTTDFSKMDEAHLREVVGSQLSELPLYLAGVQAFDVPIYTIWGENEDVQVLEKFRDGTYSVPNLHIVDAHHAPLIPGTSIRLLGIPGLFQTSLLFNIGEGKTVPGTHGSAWTGIWQLGELVHTALKTHDPEESRWLLTCSSRDRALLEKLAISFKCDAHIFSADEYSRTSAITTAYFASSVTWNLRTYKRLIGTAQMSFQRLWGDVSKNVLASCGDDENLKGLITSTVSLLTSDTPNDRLEYAYETLWHCSLANNRQSSLTFMLDDKGSFNLDIRNFGITFHGQEETASMNGSSEASTKEGSPSAAGGNNSAAGGNAGGNNSAGSNSAGGNSAGSSSAGNAFNSNDSSASNKKNRSKPAKGTTQTPSDPISDADTALSLPKAPANDLSARKGSADAETEKSPVNTNDASKSGASTATNNETKQGENSVPRDTDCPSSDGDSDAKGQTPPPAAEGAKKFDIANLPTEPAANSSKRLEKLKAKKASRDQLNQNRAKPVEEPVVARPGLWFKNGDRSPEEILGFLAEEDRKTNPTVKIIKGKPRLNGTASHNALVYFDTHEQVSAAYDRVNKEEAGTVSIYQSHQSGGAEFASNANGSAKFGIRPLKKFMKPRKKWQQ